jgi:hypothetical protein
MLMGLTHYNSCHHSALVFPVKSKENVLKWITTNANENYQTIKIMNMWNRYSQYVRHEILTAETLRTRGHTDALERRGDTDNQSQCYVVKQDRKP